MLCTVRVPPSQQEAQLAAAGWNPSFLAGHAVRKQHRCGLQRRQCLPSTAAIGSSDFTFPPPPPQQQLQSRPPRRREVVLHSVQLAVLAAAADGADGRTILNSVLSAYGLPQLKAATGYRVFDDPEEPFAFEYPKSWVRRKNSLRSGLIISNFNTADQLKVEVFLEPPAGVSLAEAAVAKLINPASEIGGDSRLELPPTSRIKTEVKVVGNKEYILIAFPSETITRSGYQVRRKNMAVAVCRRGAVYVLGCSARSDQYNADKEALFQHVVDSFHVL